MTCHQTGEALNQQSLNQSILHKTLRNRNCNYQGVGDARILNLVALELIWSLYLVVSSPILKVPFTSAVVWTSIYLSDYPAYQPTLSTWVLLIILILHRTPNLLAKGQQRLDKPGMIHLYVLLISHMPKSLEWSPGLYPGSSCSLP